MIDAFRAELRRRMAGEIRFDEPAGLHTSIGVGGKIDALLFPEDEKELADITGYLREMRIPFLPVGNWTNTIVLDGGFRGALVSISRLRGLTVRNQGGDEATLTAGAGCPLSEILNLAMSETLTGMEFCAGIPGSVGGAVRMNAGAFGGKMDDIVESLSLLDDSGAIRTASRRDLNFSYRNLDLPAETIIISASIRLRRGDREKIAARVREISGMRKERHPLEFRNAGSFFKNLPDCPAGRLIEEAGLKGTRIGDAQISEKHANFIINRGEATAGEITRLAALIQSCVLKKTGRTLDTEVRIIGEP